MAQLAFVIGFCFVALKIVSCTITPTATVVGCSDSRNVHNSSRQYPKLTCSQLYTAALNLYNGTGCTPDSYTNGSIGLGTCDNGTTRVDSLYIEYTYGSYRIIATNGIPLHDYATGAVSANPSTVCENYRVLFVPKSPKTNTTSSDTSMGAVGMSNTGAAIFNHKSAETYCNAAAISEASTFDNCNGHADTTNKYHYHKMPATSCFSYSNCYHLGYLQDGIPVYAYCNNYTSCYELNSTTTNVTYTASSNGKNVTVYNGCSTTDYSYNTTKYTSGKCDLDDANGKTVNGSYAYYFTENYPFLVTKLMGSVSTSICRIDVSSY